MEKPDQFVNVTANSSDRNAKQVVPEIRCDFQNHAEIQQDDACVGPYQNVSRVRIGMKKAVEQELIPVERNQILDHLLDIDVVLQDFIDFGNSKTLEELHYEDAGRRNFAVHSRNDDEIAVAKELCESFDVIGFMLEIHLFHNHSRKLLDDRASSPDCMVFDKLFNDEQQVLDDSNVGCDDFFHARPKDLDDDFFLFVAGSMHLAERSRCQRFLVERVKDGLDWSLQLLLDTLPDLNRRKWGNPIE